MDIPLVSYRMFVLEKNQSDLPFKSLHFADEKFSCFLEVKLPDKGPKVNHSEKGI